MKQGVSLRGVKEGYQLRIEAEESFAVVLEQLESLLKKIKEEQKNGKAKEKEDIPLIIETGNRLFSDSEKEKITSIVELHSHFNIKSFDAQVASIEKVYEWYEKNSLQLKMEAVRSGQVLDAPGDILLIGNVNPGGIIRAVGSIFVIGELRGIVHAGVEGNDQAVVVANYQFSSQVRIADNVQVLEEKEETDSNYEIAFMNDLHVLEFQPAEHSRKIRPELGELPGRLL